MATARAPSMDSIRKKTHNIAVNGPDKVAAANRRGRIHKVPAGGAPKNPRKG